MKIGVIGCGYVGQAAALNWKQKGYEISVTTRQSNKIQILETFAHHVYLLNPNSLTEFIEKQDVILISVAPDTYSLYDYEATYLQTAQAVIQYTKKNSALQQILYTGSTSVYGDHGGNWVDESTSICLEQLNPQAKILHKTEKVLLENTSKDLNVCVFRLGEIYGPTREIEERLKKTQNQPLAGTGKSFTNLIHLDDIVSALDFAIQYRLNGIYNLCNDFHIQRHLFYEKLCQREKIPLVQWDPERTNSHAGNRRVSNQKLKDLGFEFKQPSYNLLPN